MIDESRQTSDDLFKQTDASTTEHESQKGSRKQNLDADSSQEIPATLSSFSLGQKLGDTSTDIGKTSTDHWKQEAQILERQRLRCRLTVAPMSILLKRQQLRYQLTVARMSISIP